MCTFEILQVLSEYYQKKLQSGHLSSRCFRERVLYHFYSSIWKFKNSYKSTCLNYWKNILSGFISLHRTDQLLRPIHIITEAFLLGHLYSRTLNVLFFSVYMVCAIASLTTIWHLRKYWYNFYLANFAYSLYLYVTVFVIQWWVIQSHSELTLSMRC